MKFYIYILALGGLLAFVSCGKEDAILPKIVQVNDFEITDSDSDSIQHERYLLYKEYNVPVYFNDTINYKQTGVNYKNNPVYTYETIDLNWGFFNYNRNISYKYDFLVEAEQQKKALDFVRLYLQKASIPMRPFNILVVDTLTVSTNSKTERPDYYVGYRTLVLAVNQIKDTETAQDKIKEIIRDMVSSRIANDKIVCGKFEEDAVKKGWYGMSWADLGKCPTIVKWQTKSWVLSPNVLYNEAPYRPFKNEDLVTLLLKKDNGPAYLEDIDEAIAIRKKYIEEMGQYGFIRGWKETGVNTPSRGEEDREYFIQAILHLGEIGFKARYGSFKLVMDKYKILADYITEELKISLDYDGRLVED